MKSRREFLKLGSAAAGAATLGTVWPRHLWAQVAAARQTPGLWAPTVRALVGPNELAATALEAAKQAGALYADVNIFIAQMEGWGFSGTSYNQPYQQDTVGMGVRALYNGYWGFAGAQGLPSAASAARMGAAAAVQATIAARGAPRTVDLGQMPVATGTWLSPFEIDPFTISFEEKADFGTELADYTGRLTYQLGGGTAGFMFAREERTFASTEGSATTQTIYTSRGGLYVTASLDWMSEQGGMADVNFLTLAQAGWEYIRNAPYREAIPKLIEEARARRRPIKIDLGRYDLVFDASGLAGVVEATLAPATQLDRAMGYRANDEGTSYLSDPLNMLGTLQVAAPMVTLKTAPAMPAGAGTVKWDCEGVSPREVTLVKDGILTDFQTSREAAGWLAPYYQATHLPVQSNGCAGTDTDAATPVTQVVPNLALQPSDQDTTFDDLVKDTKQGIAVFGGGSSTDFQCLNGVGSGVMRKITNGQLGPFIDSDATQYTYRSSEFWKNLEALGGPGSVRQFGHIGNWRCGGSSIRSVPGKVKNVAVIDPSRKA